MAFDFSAVQAPFRMQPGLRKLESGSPQLTPLHIGDVALREKLAVLGAYAPQALLRAPGFDATPALHALYAHAATHHADALGWDGDAALVAHRLGWSVNGRVPRRHTHGPAEIGACIAALPEPWRAPALVCLAFAEDFAVLDGDTAQIPWLAVCLPSHWAPESKVGRHFAEVHAPVADNRLLITAADHLARLVTGDDAWERFVWTITRHSRLHAHPNRVDPAPWPVHADPQALAAQAFFRTERQTFIPLPHHRQAVFTIHVERQPLAQAVSSPERARQLHAALVSMSDAVLAYRNLTSVRDHLLLWLEGQAPAQAQSLSLSVDTSR